MDSSPKKRTLSRKSSRSGEHSGDLQSGDTGLFLNSVLENIPDMIFVKDARHLRFVRFNKAGEELLGIPATEMIGKNDYDFFPKQEADFFTRKDRAVLKDGRMVDIPEEPIHTKHKGVRYLHTKKIPILDERGNPQFLLGISEDITEKKKAAETLRKSHEELESRVEQRTGELQHINQALRDSEERYRTVLAALMEGVVLINAKGRILAANPSAERILGLSKDQIMSRSYKDPLWGTVHEDGSTSVEEFFTARSLRTGESYVNAVTGLRRSDGRLIWLMGNTQPLFRPNEAAPYAVVASFFDITDRKEMEAQIQKLNAELEQKVQHRTAELIAANKELESFSYSVSHDLRAPLRAIEGFAGILMEDHFKKLDEEGRRLLSVIRQNARHMSQLIDDLLNFARIGRQNLTRQTIDVLELVHSVIEELSHYDSQEKPEIVIQSALPAAPGDTVLLRQVFLNLLSNAFKFTRHQEKPRIEIGFQKQGPETVYYIRDNGVGFDMQYADKLFGVFQRLHSVKEFEGTGVGLAIVQRIIHRHGGRIWAESKLDGGASFYFTLPPTANV